MILFAASLSRQRPGRRERSHEAALTRKPAAKAMRKPAAETNSRSSKRGPITDRAPATSRPISFLPR